MSFIVIIFQNLHISKKSSTFALAFEKEAIFFVNKND